MKHRPRRDAFTLLEVILALAILVGSIAMLGELARLGLENAATARDLTSAELLCEEKLNELVCGAAPMEEIELAPLEDLFEEDSGWLYSIQLEPTPEPGLVALHVTVAQDLPETRKPVFFTLVRWVRDPHGAPTLGSPSATGVGISGRSTSSRSTSFGAAGLPRSGTLPGGAGGGR
jgi:prepilin-type N-terminal cleavage/methylation domain-containing protein